MKSKECKLIVNARNGYCFSPETFKSISEAVRAGKESGGFAYRVFVNGVVVRRGYCNY